ncbi:hypothetical protein BDZ89DRAFT_1142997 [Hymenopellis radicata]|nr:hypothetical protein BDZ89DRAFT_1142997 [Hymenopellis radicata]
MTHQGYILDGTFDFHALVAAFDTMVVIGFVMIAIVLVPAWRSSEICRLKTWFALMIAGLVYSVSYFLIVGRQFGEEPAFGLCLLQASLIYAAPVLTSTFSLSFTVELYVILFDAVRGVGPGRCESSKWFIAIPLIIYFAVLCEVLVTGLLDHTKIVRNPSHVYCHATVSYPYYVTSIVGLFTFLAVLVLEVVMLHMLVVTRKELGLHRSTNDAMFPAGLFFRALLFSLYTALGIVLSAVALASTHALFPYEVLFFPTFCIVVAVIFGTQKDILKFYRDLFVKRTENRDSTSLRQIPDAVEMPMRRSAKDDFLDA